MTTTAKLIGGTLVVAALAYLALAWSFEWFPFLQHTDKVIIVRDGSVDVQPSLFSHSDDKKQKQKETNSGRLAYKWHQRASHLRLFDGPLNAPCTDQVEFYENFPNASIEVKAGQSADTVTTIYLERKGFFSKKLFMFIDDPYVLTWDGTSKHTLDSSGPNVGQYQIKSVKVGATQVWPINNSKGAACVRLEK